MTNATLSGELENLERKWVACLQARFTADRSWPSHASDEVQFFSADWPMMDEQSEHNHNAVSERQLLIVCVGMNYNAYGHQGQRTGTPRLYTRSNGQSWIVDEKRSRATRRPLLTALVSYEMNSDTWLENGYASAANLLPVASQPGRLQRPLTLIKTCISPFVPTKPWSEFSGAARRETFEAWDPNQHICDLIETIGKHVDLWVIHGTYVWPHFETTSPHISRWLLTPTLSFESQRNGSITTFWKTKRREYPPSRPLFPSC